MREFIFLALLTLSSPIYANSYAAPRFESAQAFPGETYRQLQTSGSAYSHKQNFSANLDVSILPQWKSGAAKLEEVFEKVRDVRIYNDGSGSQFKRRAPWLYPVDGCYTRAAHMARGFERLKFVKPGKVFAFGTWATLRVKTPYAPNGKAWWSFHTAAAYRLGNRAMVLDPSIDPTRILPIEEWVGLIAPDPSKITIAVCDGNAYAPSQTCIGGSEKQDYWAVSSLEDYLDDEWRNLLGLGLNPVKLLGDFPPWRIAP